jgi:hypothetical protein
MNHPGAFHSIDHCSIGRWRHTVNVMATTDAVLKGHVAG